MEDLCVVPLVLRERTSEEEEEGEDSERVSTST